MRKNFFFLGLAFIAVFCSNISVFGQCSCMFVSPDSENAEIVFTGKIISRTNDRRYKIRITDIFKGLKNEQIVEAVEGGCNNLREENKEYLFIASKDQKAGEINILGCSYSYENIDKQKQFIEILRWQKRSKDQGGMLAGIVSGHNRLSDDAQKVYVESESGEKFEVKIEDEGLYKLENLKPGKYRVFLKLPETLTTYGDKEDFDLAKSVRDLKISNNQGAIADFSILVNGIISGRVVDEKNQPVSGVEVNLYFLDEQENKETLQGVTKAAADGTYFFKGLETGRYFIKIGAKDWYLDPTSKNFNFPITYFPNETSRTKAGMIELGKAEVLKDKNIRLTSLGKRTVTGQITLEDGKPAVNARIMIQIKRENDNQKMRSGAYSVAKTDSNGNFMFDALENTEYLVQAKIYKITGPASADVLFSSECFVFPKTGQIASLKIVLKKGFNECDEEKFGF